MLLSDLLNQLPPETRADVAKACKGWNRRIRRELTEQFLRFNLQHRRDGRSLNASVETAWGKAEDRGEPASERSARGRDRSRSVPPDAWALPKQLEDRQIPEGCELAALLSVHAPAAYALKDASTRVSDAFEPRLASLWQHESHIEPSTARATLRDAGRLADEMLKLMQPRVPDSEGGSSRFDLVRWILEADADVLGLYEFDPRDDGAEPNPSGKVTVFWGAVGLVAASLGVPAGDLAAVTLIHELAHGYTHLGHDRDGIRWSGRAFAATEPQLAEALAQYFTHLICFGLRAEHPGLWRAYSLLLPKQPHWYHGHLAWLLGTTPEPVASALARIRRGAVNVDRSLFTHNGPVTYEEFCRELKVDARGYRDVDDALETLAERSREEHGRWR